MSIVFLFNVFYGNRANIYISVFFQKNTLNCALKDCTFSPAKCILVIVHLTLIPFCYMTLHIPTHCVKEIAWQKSKSATFSTSTRCSPG